MTIRIETGLRFDTRSFKHHRNVSELTSCSEGVSDLLGFFGPLQTLKMAFASVDEMVLLNSHG